MNSFKFFNLQEGKRIKVSWRNLMKLLVTILNIFLLMVGLFIHISTYFHLDISKYTILEKLFYTSVLLLGFGLFIFMFVNFKVKGIEITPLDALNKLPNAVKGSIIIFFIITLVVFVSISVLLSGGGTQIIDGQYFLTNRGIIIRAITEVEFNKYQFLELRMSSM